MKIVYSFNKRGCEAQYWAREIAASSTSDVEFIPFNHDPYLDPARYIRAQLLDNLYYERHPGLFRLYDDLNHLLDRIGAEALLVDNCPPYHPEFLLSLKVYKVLRIADGPLSSYDRDFAYLHAYDHVLYHSPAYSRDIGMEEKLRYCGARHTSFWPFAAFEAMHDPTKTPETILASERDIDIIFIGALHPNKMPLLAEVKRAFGRSFRLHGLTSVKKNVYFNLKYGFPGWVSPVPGDQYVRLYQRSKIGINVHNRGDYTVGSYRLFDLPANGVLQLSDGGAYLDRFFAPGHEIVAYSSVADLIDKIRYYLSHDDERKAIAMNGYLRTCREHSFRARMHQGANLIRLGMGSSPARSPS